MVENRQTTIAKPTLPDTARLPINRCSLPAIILGSLTFQRHPVPLYLDGVTAIHAKLFDNLNTINEQQQRAVNFQDYMRSSFLLDNPDEAGYMSYQGNWDRSRADYLRILLGWLFDSNNKEGAVLKSWVESRFGLLPRNHNGPLTDFDSETYLKYLSDRSLGLYNTNALESQLDLLYSYCQYELQRLFPEQSHMTLFRGTNRIDEYEILLQKDKNTMVVLLNNLNSFTCQRERADEFGDYILEVKVPLAKLLYMPGLLPDMLKGEDEYLVIGGVYEVGLSIF